MDLLLTKITADMMLARFPCPAWPRERIAAYIGDGKTIPEILQDVLDKKISRADALSWASRFLPDDLMREFGIWAARRCGINTYFFKLYIDTLEKYHNGQATRDEMRAAYRADEMGDWDALAKNAFCTASKFFVDWAAAMQDASLNYGDTCREQVSYLTKLMEARVTARNPEE